MKLLPVISEWKIHTHVWFPSIISQECIRAWLLMFNHVALVKNSRVSRLAPWDL